MGRGWLNFFVHLCIIDATTCHVSAGDETSDMECGCHTAGLGCEEYQYSSSEFVIVRRDTPSVIRT